MATHALPSVICNNLSLPKRHSVTEYLASPNFVRKYDKRNKNLTTLSSVVFVTFVVNFETSGYNTIPLDDFSGLTPNEMHELS